ncbi:hypothetical protein CISG_01242 [Coccidioides immitis RMSCC 3703]|uniref:Uncharacterized protein n=1 Tax=Coccidioides immitis RMSCC 3703 TaxID=454286 RepID=A0A0J8QUD9_COCIT|nr:hypothetical protein CISG_01242 [Coccidioides immitis RMSCC 3703]
MFWRRNQCPQIDKFQAGLKEKVLCLDAQRKIVQSKAGIMGVVEVGGEVKPGMRIVVEKPAVHERWKGGSIHNPDASSVPYWYIANSGNEVKGNFLP